MEASTSPPSSPLSSICSVSPTPPSSYTSPQDYPSPSSINLSGDGSSTPTRNAPACDNDGPPPAKKRKTIPPKERKTEHLDLRNFGMSDNSLNNKEQEMQLNRLTKALRGKRKIVVIAGAGISVSAGIPDFRSSTGLFTTLRAEHKLKASGKHLFDASVYKNDDSTSSFHDMVRELSHLTQKAEPTAFHHMLATLAEEGRLLRLYSQNIDGIDTRLPPLATQIPLGRKGPWPRTIQLHGGLEKMVCTKCGHLSAFDGALFEGSKTPSCPECEGIDGARIVAGLRGHGVGRLRPRMVLYNEFNPDDEAIGAVSHADLKSRPDAVIVVGTSLKVPGVRRIVKEMCSVTRGRRDGFTAWINNDPEPLGIDLKDSWDLVVRGTSDEVARHVGLPKWNEDVGEYQMLVSDEEKARVPKDNLLGVVVESKQMSAVKSEGGFLTPTASPRQQSPTPWVGLGKMKQPKLFQDAKSASAKPSSTKSTSTKAGIVKKEKKVPAKPRKKPAATNPNNKITSTFNTTKVSKATTTKANKSPVVEVPSHLPCRFPGLEKQQISTPMRPISPNLHRNNSNASIKDEVDTPGNSSFVTCLEDPVTPTTSEKDPYDRSLTISPPSKPSNMTNLID